MSTDQNQTDPYAELKTAWEAGRRIRVKYQRGGWDQWRTKGVDGSFCWNEKPECYEIEPLPADKWAKEKTAHAQGKRIEMLISDDEYGPERWSFCELPDWHDRCEYRIAPDPDPAPAGKTDEQLGEIGKAAAKCTVHWSQINTAFAAAVREAVGKEQAEEIARLTAEVQSLNESYRVAGRVVREVQAELAKANAELERLRWRSVEVKPTREDADPEGFIEVMGKTDKRFLIPWYEVGLGKESLWRPFCPPPTPSAEEKSRTEFEAWIKQMFPGYALSKTDTGSYKDLNTRIAFAGWQAHASKEVK